MCDVVKGRKIEEPWLVTLSEGARSTEYVIYVPRVLSESLDKRRTTSAVIVVN